MVDEMTPEVVYQSVQATPRPPTNIPACADELLQELGSEELFKSPGYRVHGLARLPKEQKKMPGGEV